MNPTILFAFCLLIFPSDAFCLLPFDFLLMFAVLSCDLDTVDRHLQGYGFEGEPPCELIYRRAVPRLLELLAELGIPGVLFVIARDAASQAGLLREAVAAGHEVGSHSLTNQISSRQSCRSQS